MQRVEIAVKTRSGYRASEMMADLRNAAELLFFPMRSVGYWDLSSSDHGCPQAQLGHTCPHLLPPEAPGFVDYLVTVERDLDGVLDIFFPHARVHIYLS